MNARVASAANEHPGLQLRFTVILFEVSTTMHLSRDKMVEREVYLPLTKWAGIAISLLSSNHHHYDTGHHITG